MLKNAAHSRCANCSKIDDHSAQKLLTKHIAAVTGARRRKVVGRPTSDGTTGKPAVDALGQAVGGEGPPDGSSLVFRDDQGPDAPRARSGDASSRTG